MRTTQIKSNLYPNQYASPIVGSVNKGSNLNNDNLITCTRPESYDSDGIHSIGMEDLILAIDFFYPWLSHLPSPPATQAAAPNNPPAAQPAGEAMTGAPML
jgi:hypothetical protein